jgi:glycosyltransferase involved in cell wall biosynthesis
VDQYESRRVRILQLTKKFPFPVRDGESVAVTTLSKGLVDAGFEVSLFSLNTSRHFYPYNEDQCPEELSHYTEIHSISIHTGIHVWGALMALLRGQSYLISRFEQDKARNQLGSLLRSSSFDIVLLETTYVGGYVDLIRHVLPRARIILRAHNIEHEVWDGVSQDMRNPLKKAYLRFATNKLRKDELLLFEKIDALMPVTKRDGDVFTSLGYNGFMHILPVTLPVPQFNEWVERNEGAFRVGFIGSMDWLPNKDGLTWFIQEVVRSFTAWEDNRVRFVFAGRHSPKELMDMEGEFITVLGEVDDVATFYQHVDVVVIPVFRGSGVRVKALEAMQYRRSVISTRKGIEGLDIAHKLHFMQADSRDEFIDAIRYLMLNPHLKEEIEDNAFKYVSDQSDQKRIYMHLRSILQNLIEKHS